MSNTFTTDTTAFEANATTEAFTATSLSHCHGTFSASGMERENGETHVSAYVHNAEGIRFEAGVDIAGEPTVRIRITGKVRTYVTVFGVSLADLAAAATEALRAEQQS